MGAWGAGILQDDSAMDIISDYRVLLGYKVPNEEAYELVKNYYYPDFKGQDDEDIFWFALAIYQLRNGILLDEVKEKAKYFLKNPTSLEVWKESGKSVYQNRLKVLEKLKEELENPSVTEPKKIPKPPAYCRFKTKYKEGDILACEVQDEDGYISKEYIGKYFLIQVIHIRKSPSSRLKPELDYLSRAVVAAYKWVGDSIPDINDVKNLDFLNLDLVDTRNMDEDDDTDKYITVIGNNEYYKTMMFKKNPGVYPGYDGVLYDIYTSIEDLRKKGEKFEALGD